MPDTITSDMPFPPPEFMRLISGMTTDNETELREMFVRSGQLQAQRFANLGLLNRALHLLDVGSGCGRFARALMPTDVGSYTGFDRHPDMVRWTRENISPRDTRFRFLHVDVASPYDDIDGVRGAHRAETFRFPFDDNAFSAANLASVFTHMHLSEIDAYARELARVVRPGGTMVFSAFVTMNEPYVRDLFNVHVRPAALRETIEKAGWTFCERDQARFASNDFLFDKNQQNFFVAIRQ